MRAAGSHANEADSHIHTHTHTLGTITDRRVGSFRTHVGYMDAHISKKKKFICIYWNTGRYRESLWNNRTWWTQPLWSILHKFTVDLTSVKGASVKWNVRHFHKSARTQEFSSGDHRPQRMPEFSNVSHFTLLLCDPKDTVTKGGTFLFCCWVAL